MKRTTQFDAYEVIVHRIGNDKVALSFCTNGKTDYTAKVSAPTALRVARAILEKIVAEAPAPTPDKLSTMEFISRWEAGGMTQEQFDASAQAFVDSGIWRHLQGSWQRQVYSWAEDGLITL